MAIFRNTHNFICLANGNVKLLGWGEGRNGIAHIEPACAPSFKNLELAVGFKLALFHLKYHLQ